VRSEYSERKCAKDKIGSFNEDSNRNTEALQECSALYPTFSATYEYSLGELSENRNGRSVLEYYEELEQGVKEVE
jgi:hypothetical protein